ncbi:MAG: copper resistance protein CopC/CopD [Catenulispora sp.]|nr:copper resistance protein CopC/CopD [Catenulispora sp.]
MFWLVAGLVVASPARAHAELVSSDPEDGARLDAVPARVTLTFSEEIAVSECGVQANGHAAPVHGLAGQPAVLVADLAGVQPDHGLVTLSWHSVSSDDGHVADGGLRFTIGTGSAGPATPAPSTGAAPDAAPDAAPATSPSTASGAVAGAPSSATPNASPASAPGPVTPFPRPDPTVRHLVVLVQIVGFTATALFVGGLVFLTAIWPAGAGERRTRRLLAVAWFLGLLAAAAEIPLRAAYAALHSVSGIFDGAAVETLLSGRLGATLIAKALLWVAGGVVLAAVLQRAESATRLPGWRLGLAAVGFGLLRTGGMPGHDDSSHPLAGAVADTVHLAGVVLWVGGLAVLLIGVLPRRRPEELAVVVRRYSNLALVSVTAIIAAGVVLAWHLIGSMDALLHSSYGHLLLVKVGIVAAVLLVAQHSKAWVRHRLDVAVLLHGDRAVVRPFLYSVAAETGLALAILTAAGLLVTSSPGR